MNASPHLLEVSHLSTSFFSDQGEIRAVEDVSFSVQPGQTVALVGESGCGKSVTALSIMQLVDFPGKVVGGQVVFKGSDLLTLPDKDIRRIRGNQISMVFQEPMTSLNPVFTVGDQIGEVLEIHTTLTKREIRREVLRLLEKVHISSPDKRIDQYPHEMSGGMKQRVMIAMALACQPDLLIADEPTTALDVTIQAQILELLKELQREMGMAILLITHNLGRRGAVRAGRHRDVRQPDRGTRKRAATLCHAVPSVYTRVVALVAEARCAGNPARIDPGHGSFSPDVLSGLPLFNPVPGSVGPLPR